MSPPPIQPPNALPLSGLRVVDFTRLLPGPYCTLILADLGASVIKVEEPGIGDYLRLFPPLAPADGQPMSAAFAALNRQKQSVALDLRGDSGKQRAKELCSTADVVVEGFRPGVMQRLGLDYDSLKATNPRLIMASISGYGQTGPLAQRAGHDLNYMALSGALHRNAPTGGAPHPLSVQVADLAAGALFPATGILAALFARERHGQGAYLDCAMSDGAVALMPFAFANHAYEQSVGSANGSHLKDNDVLAGTVPAYAVYPTSDDRYLAVAALEPKFWQKLCVALNKPELAASGLLGGEAGRAVWRELAALFRQRTRDEWVEILSEHDCCVEPVLAVEEVSNHPHHQARGLFVQVQHGLKKMTQVRTPLFLEQQQRAPDPSPAPALGRHHPLAK